jgi:hypothetical protein
VDPFRVLGVTPAATDAELRDAYLRRSKELHPDRYADASEADRAAATRAMQELNVAYDAARARDRYVAPPTPPPTYTYTPPRPRRVRWFVIALAVAVLGVGALASSGSSKNAPLPGMNFAQLEGKCVTFDKVGLPDDVVDCTRPHDARVMKLVDHGTPCPIWTNEQIAGTPVDLCLDTHQ